MVQRRIVVLAMMVAVGLLEGARTYADDKPPVEVFKLPDCACCKNWIKYLEDDGYPVHVTDVADVEARTKNQDRLGVPVDLRACHTAVIAGYVVEGHVSREEIAWLLRERPRIKGLFVKGMPKGAPGMEGGNAEGYEVVAVDLKGQETVLTVHAPESPPP